MDELRIPLRIVTYYFTPLVAAIIAHYRIPYSVRSCSWGISNYAGLLLGVVFTIFLLKAKLLMPEFYEVISGPGRSGRLDLMLWSLGFVLVIYPHVLKRVLAGARPTPIQGMQLERVFSFKVVGWLLLTILFASHFS